jgi:hypothetical protein
LNKTILKKNSSKKKQLTSWSRPKNAQQVIASATQNQMKVVGQPFVWRQGRRNGSVGT